MNRRCIHSCLLCATARCRNYSSSSSKRGPYEVLELDERASQMDIKNAFYTMSKKYHPDVTCSDAQSATKFMEINEAYDHIKDENKRRLFDKSSASIRSQRQPSQRSYDQQNYSRRTTQRFYTNEDFYTAYESV